MISKENRSFWMSIDILNILGRADRLNLLIALKPGRQQVNVLTLEVYGDRSNNHCTQASAALAPLRRVGLVNASRLGKYVFYELTDLGHEAVKFVEVIGEQLDKRKAPVGDGCATTTN